MVATRSLFAATFLLFASLAAASPAASQTSSAKSSTKTTTTHKSTTTKHSSTTSKKSSSTTTTTITTSAYPTCSPEAYGIIQPTNGATIVQIQDDNEDPTYFEVIYCSGQYFKTYSIDGSVWLSGADVTQGGQLLINHQQPDNLDASAGFYSYRFNVSVAPEDGSYTTGQQTLSVYEAVSGYYNPMNFEINSITLNFTVRNSS